MIPPLALTLGLPGWLLLLGAVVGLLIRLLKTDTANTALSAFGMPPLPKKILPWLALFLGFVSGAIEAKSAGRSWGDSALTGLWGIFGGGQAVVLNEAGAGLMRKVLGDKAADVVFGANAGPGLPNSAAAALPAPLPPPPPSAPKIPPAA